MSRPFTLYGHSELQRLAATLGPLASAWIGQWLDGVPSQVICLQAGPTAQADGEWLLAKSSTGNTLYLFRPPSFAKLMTVELFGDLAKSGGLGDTPSPLVGDAIQAILLGLISAFNTGLNPSAAKESIVLINQGPSPTEFMEGSGAVLASLQVGTLTLQFLIPAKQCLDFLRTKNPNTTRKTALPPLEQALAQIQNKPIKLSAFLGEAEIDIGTLQTSSIGDVIRLYTPIDKPAQLATGNGTPLCKGYLGTSENYKSLQLCR